MPHLAVAIASGQAGVSVLELMRETAARFIEIIGAQPNAVELPRPTLPRFSADLRWDNTLFKSTSFRRAHVELLEIKEHFAVVHVVISPYLNGSAPIFGFDMIAGKSQATGIFLDYSPSTQASSPLVLSAVLPQSLRRQFTQMRTRPEWGAIFSDDFFAIRPADSAEVQSALALAETALVHYLRYLAACQRTPCGVEAVSRQGQERYATAQRMNPHTCRMLARYIGSEAARSFIDEVLFPLPDIAA